MPSNRTSYGNLRPEEATTSKSVYSSGKLLRVEYSISSLSAINFIAKVGTRDISISVVSNDVAGDINVYQSLDGVIYSEITGDGLPIAASAIGSIDSDIINLSGIAESFLKIVYNKTSAGSNPYVAVLCVGTGG